jgi:hypothetical protein
MVVFEDGNYETGYWLTAESYPERVCYEVEEGSELALKIVALYPFYTMDIVDGVLVDVTEREKTQEEIDAENAPPPKTEEQLRIEQLESDNASLLLAVADLYEQVILLQGGGA